MRSDWKKILLSFGVIAIFSGYVVYQKKYAETNLNILTTQKPSANTTQLNWPGRYNDGEYTGIAANSFYGDVQVKAIISGGKLTDIQFLIFPNDRGQSLSISNQSLPQLKSEAIAAQSANVNIVSGATQTSETFIASLESALTQASS
jgi:uncharacterized protein with FMN-binding domain